MISAGSSTPASGAVFTTSSPSPSRSISSAQIRRLAHAARTRRHFLRAQASVRAKVALSRSMSREGGILLRQMVLAAARADYPVRIGAAYQLLEFGPAIVALIFENRHSSLRQSHCYFINPRTDFRRRRVEVVHHDRKRQPSPSFAIRIAR